MPSIISRVAMTSTRLSAAPLPTACAPRIRPVGFSNRSLKNSGCEFGMRLTESWGITYTTSQSSVELRSCFSFRPVDAAV